MKEIVLASHSEHADDADSETPFMTGLWYLPACRDGSSAVELTRMPLTEDMMLSGYKALVRLFAFSHWVLETDGRTFELCP